MNELQTSNTDRIATLHAEVVSAVRSSLEKAIEIGELLEAEKANVAHGEWSKWIEENVPFDIRTAQRYMKANANRDRIKYDSVSLLTEAYRAIEKPKTKNRAEELQRRLDDVKKRQQEAFLEEMQTMKELGQYSLDCDKLEVLHERNDKLQSEGDKLIEQRGHMDLLDWLDAIEEHSKRWNALFAEYYELRDSFPEFAKVKPITDAEIDDRIAALKIQSEMPEDLKDLDAKSDLILDSAEIEADEERGGA